MDRTQVSQLRNVFSKDTNCIVSDWSNWEYNQ